MPTFEVEISGKPYEVDAPDQNAAVAGAQQYHNNAQVTAPSVASAAVEGMPIIGGLAPKIGAAVQAATEPLLGRGSTADTYDQRYAENLARHQARQDTFAQENPITNTAAGIAGGTLATLPLGATGIGARALGITGPSLLARMGTGLASGTAIGAADAATRGNDILPGAVFGGLAGGATPAIASGIGRVVSGIRGQLTPTPTAPTNVATIGGVDLPITGGEAAGNFNAIQAERAALRGQNGEPAQHVAQNFFDARQQAIPQATQGVKASLSPSGVIEADTPREAGDIISASLRNARDIAKANVDQAYDAVRKLPTVVPADQLGLVARRVKADLTFSNDPVVVTERNTPASAHMLDLLDSWGGNPQSGMPQNKANMFGALGQSNPAGNTMQDIDMFRQQLRSIKDSAANGGDQRAASRILKSFDQQVDHIAPSPELTAARQAHAEYKQALYPQGPRDDVGREIQRILGSKGGQPATASEVSNILYGSPQGTSPRVVERLASIFGPDSPQFTAVKQGYLAHLLEAPAGGQPYGEQALASRIVNALSGKQSELTNKILTAPERAELAQLGAYYRRITAPNGAVNTSGTSAPLLQKIGKILPAALSMIGGAIGAHVGGPVGMIAGATAGLGQKAVTSRLAARSVARSLYGVRPPPPAPSVRGLYLAPPVLTPQFQRAING